MVLVFQIARDENDRHIACLSCCRRLLTFSIYIQKAKTKSFQHNKLEGDRGTKKREKVTYHHNLCSCIRRIKRRAREKEENADPYFESKCARANIM